MKCEAGYSYTCLSLILLLLRCSVAECFDLGVLAFWSGALFPSTFTLNSSVKRSKTIRPTKILVTPSKFTVSDPNTLKKSKKRFYLSSLVFTLIYSEEQWLPLLWVVVEHSFLRTKSSSSSKSSSCKLPFADFIISMKLWLFCFDDGLLIRSQWYPWLIFNPEINKNERAIKETKTESDWLRGWGRAETIEMVVGWRLWRSLQRRRGPLPHLPRRFCQK